MNKKPIFLILYFLVSLTLNSQIKKDSLKPRHYIPIKQYKKLSSEKLSRTDSLNFIFKDNDTLVRVDNKKNMVHTKGVKIPYEYKDSLFLDFYTKVAFSHKKDSFSIKTTMKYWKKPIKIFFSKSISRKTQKAFLKFASYLSENVDSLEISEVKQIEKSNYIIYYKDDYQYESKMYNYKNTDYYMYWNKKNQIYRCALRIDNNTNFNEELRLFQMKEYFFKSLGYFKLSNEFDCSSYYSNCYSEQKKITKFDLELLRYHYSYGICKGTSLKEFQESHKNAKEHLRSTGRLIFYINPN